MASVNKVILIGYCGADVEVRHTKDETPVARISLATNESWTDRNGERQERTEWHQVVVWNKPAEFAGQYVHKGSLVYVEGKIQTREYQTKDGEDRKATEIIAQTIKLLDRRESEDPGTPEERDQVPF